MSIVSSVYVGPDGNAHVFEFTDHLGNIYREIHRVPEGQTPADFMVARAAALEAELAQREIDAVFLELDADGIDPDRVPQHQTQTEFDRRVLGRLMTQVNVYMLSNSLTFWAAVQARHGNNKPQRAASLGVPQAEYDEVDKRMNDTLGALTFLNDDKGQRWPEVKTAWL